MFSRRQRWRLSSLETSLQSISHDPKTRYKVPTLQEGALDHRDFRPASERPRLPREPGSNCIEAIWQARYSQPRLIQNIVQPSQADSGLEAVLGQVVLFFDGAEQDGNGLRKARGGRRCCGRRALCSKDGYLRFSATSECEALMRR